MTGSDIRPFRPKRGTANPHVQTLVSRALRARVAPRYRRARIETPDGDFLDLDEWEPPPRPRGACLLLHGLEGCAHSGYMVCTALALAERGIASIALNFRGCSGEPNRTPGSYHSGRTDDIERALAWIGARYPGLPRAAIGFSLGGNALLNHLGRAAGQEAVEAAAAVSVPFDLAACAAALERGLGRAYAAFFLRTLRAKAREKAGRFATVVPLEAVEARTIREFDDLLTAPLHGFRDAADYYHRCSAARFLDEIRVPTLLVQSTDDPLVPWSASLESRIRDQPRLALALTRHGGHVGFLARRAGVGSSGWLEGSVAGFVADSVGEGARAPAGTARMGGARAAASHPIVGEPAG